MLSRAFEDDPPDLILLETLSLVRTSTYATVERLLGTGLPVWLSFRRCRHGVCGVYGEHGVAQRGMRSVARRAGSRRWVSTRC